MDERYFGEMEWSCHSTITMNLQNRDEVELFKDGLKASIEMTKQLLQDEDLSYKTLQIYLGALERFEKRLKVLNYYTNSGDHGAIPTVLNIDNHSELPTG